jgi:uncharacterized integral membrane protein (TIGR00698 family)
LNTIFHARTLHRVRAVVPGALVAGTVAAAATYLGEHYGAPVLLFALLLGMALNFLYADKHSCSEGIEFTASRILRIGVALLGFRISFEDVLTLGWETLALVCVTTVLTIGFGACVARLLGRSVHMGLLTGGAVGICGASAAVAIFSVLSHTKLRQIDLTFTIASVTALSTLAMIIYPIIAVGTGLDDTRIGILFGATIHDVAQVVGAGYAVSDSTGNIATTVKLFRVALLVPAVLTIACLAANDGTPAVKKHVRLPGFAVAFAIFIIINSIGIIPDPVQHALAATSRWLLVMAIVAVGMMTSLKSIADLGIGHVVLVAGETVWLFGTVLALLAWIQLV